MFTVLEQWERMSVLLQSNLWEAMTTGTPEEFEEANIANEMYSSISLKMRTDGYRVDLSNCTTKERKFFWAMVRERDLRDAFSELK